LLFHIIRMLHDVVLTTLSWRWYSLPYLSSFDFLNKYCRPLCPAFQKQNWYAKCSYCSLRNTQNVQV